MPSKMYLGLMGALFALPTLAQNDTSGLDEFLESQEKIAIAGVLANIGADGERVDGAGDGIVVASPSKSDPDCKQHLSWP